MECTLLMEEYDYNILIALFDLFANTKLFISKDRDEIFNISLPNKDELLERINKLISMGFIYCKYKNRNPIYKNSILESDIDITLHLTAKGGELIEEKLNILWDEYIYEEVEYQDEDTYKITIQSRSLEKIYEIQTFLPIEYKKIEILTPWFPVYWKKLLKGYKISVSITEKYYINNLQNNQKYLSFIHPFYSKGKGMR